MGLPETVDPHKTATLGMQLVMTLTDQLNGAIELKRENGTEFTVIFSEAKAGEQVQ